MAKTTLESEIEQYMVSQVKKHGGELLKFLPYVKNGMPDRLLLHPILTKTTFVELKAPGEKPRKLQEAIHKQLQSLGAQVITIDSKNAADQFLNDQGILNYQKTDTKPLPPNVKSIKRKKCNNG